MNTTTSTTKESLSRMLAVQVAAKCLETIRMHNPNMGEAAEIRGVQPTPDRHLAWMCQKINEHCQDWDTDKLHRWVGFIQGSMVEKGYSTIDEERSTIVKMKESMSCPAD